MPLPAPADQQAELPRRLLLALVTALIVARPLVLGEDPGLLNRLTNAWTLLLTLLWLLAAIGWAAWRAWSGRTSWRGGAVEAGLLAVAGLMWVSTLAAADYQHPARLIASEWLISAVAFCLVRQLSRTPEEDRGLLAAILASAVSISAFALYQYTIEFPQIRQTYGKDLDALLDAMAVENVVANPRLLQQRLFENNVFATYAHPNSFAGYLALLFPMAIAWTLARGFRASAARSLPAWYRLRVALAAASTLLIGIALWLTHSRGAILGCLLVGIAVLVLSGRRFIAAHKAVFLIGLAIVSASAVFLFRTESGASGMAKFWESSAKRNDYWIGTWSLIRDHPWLGVGPGNFGRLYPRTMLPRAFEQIKDPHNFLLETWATGGLFALIALCTTLAMFFRRSWPALRNPWHGGGGAGPALADLADGTHRMRWEFCLGGMGGLILGFMLRVMNQSADEILIEGAYSACRSLVWFGAFALFFSIPWSGASRPVALVAGVAALLLNLLVSGGIAMPSVAQPLWVMAALALNSIDSAPPAALPSTRWRPRMLPLPILGGIGLAYGVLLFYPVVTSWNSLAQARGHYSVWKAEEQPPGFLESNVLDPLRHAVEADPDNAMAWLELAEWYGELLKVSPTPEPALRSAIRCAQQAHLLDSDNKEPYLFEYSVHMLMAQGLGNRASEEYGRAAAAMRAAVERDPTSAQLRYQLAEVLFLADLAVEGRHHARIAAELDQQATTPERHLIAERRELVQKWLMAKE